MSKNENHQGLHYSRKINLALHYIAFHIKLKPTTIQLN